MKASKHKMARTQAALAAALGKTQQAVSLWMKDRRWNLSKTPPWDVEKVRAWAAMFMRLPSGGKRPAVAAKMGASHSPQSLQIPEDIAGQTRRAECVIKIENAKTLQHARGIREGQYMLRSEVEQKFLDRIQCVNEGLKRFTWLLPDQLAMKKSDEILGVLEEKINLIRRAVRDDNWLEFDAMHKIDSTAMED